MLCVIFILECLNPVCSAGLAGSFFLPSLSTCFAPISCLLCSGFRFLQLLFPLLAFFFFLLYPCAFLPLLRQSLNFSLFLNALCVPAVSDRSEPCNVVHKVSDVPNQPTNAWLGTRNGSSQCQAFQQSQLYSNKAMVKRGARSGAARVRHMVRTYSP